MGEPQPTRAEYLEAARERDVAIAERDYALQFIQEIADAVSWVDVVAVGGHLKTLRAMAALAREPEEAA
jgi:hypothetical protein